MGLIKGRDQPVRDYLTDLFQAAQAGICMVTDPRGIAVAGILKRLAYIVQPTSGTTAMLLEVDLETRAMRTILGFPAAAGAGAYNTAIMAALYDPTGGGAVNTPTVYILVSLTAAPWAQWMSYTPATDAWAILAAPPCGPAGATPLAVSVSLCHPCGTLGNFVALNANIDEDFIYADGDAGQWGAAGPSNIAQYSKAGNAWVVLAPVGARGAAPGAGSKCVWLPNYPNWILSTQGGGLATWSTYGFAGNAWAAPFTPIPATNLGEGSELCTLYEAPGWIAIRPAGHVKEILAIEAGAMVAVPPGGRIVPVCQIDDAMLPAAHASNALIAWWLGGDFFFGAIPYGRSVVRRIQIPMPL